MTGPQFHETPQGQEFFRVQFPLLVKTMVELARAEALLTEGIVELSKAAKDLSNEVYKLTEELKRRSDP